MAREPRAVLLPGLLRQGREARQLPARLADHDVGVAVELLHVDARHLDKPELRILHPVPVGAHLDQPAKAPLGVAQRAFEPGDIVHQQHRAKRRPGRVAHHGAARVRPDRGAVLVDIAPLGEARFRLSGDHLRSRDGGRLQIIEVHHVQMGFLQELLFVVAEEATQRRVRPQESAADGKQRDAHRGMLVKRIESGAARYRGVGVCALVSGHVLTPLPQIMTQQNGKRSTPGKGGGAPRAKNRQSACLRRKAGMSYLSTPLCCRASTVEARLRRITAGTASSCW